MRRWISRYGAPMDSIRVFLVDDHPLVREGIRRLLESGGDIVVVGDAGSAEECWDRLDTQQVDVVLMDVALPGVDGIEATRRIKASRPDLKVVMLSSFNGKLMARAIEAGASGYVLKTATQAELVSAVVQAADGRSPIDPRLTAGLLEQLHELSRTGKKRGLSCRQMEVMRLIAGGVPSAEISVRLSISAATLTREVRWVFNILGVDDRAHAVSEAYKRKLLE